MICSKCNQIKSDSDFSKVKRRTGKYGLKSVCKFCSSQITKEWIKNNKQKHIDYNKSYGPKWFGENKERYYNNINNWKLNNPDYFNEYNKELRKNPIEKLKQNVRVTINRGLKNKSKKSLEIIGLESWDKLREHIEKQFTEGMNWENYGVGKNNTTWHIDHIIPLSSVKTEEEVIKLNYYTNLQPMWGSDNIKKSNKVI